MATDRLKEIRQRVANWEAWRERTGGTLHPNSMAADRAYLLAEVERLTDEVETRKEQMAESDKINERLQVKLEQASKAPAHRDELREAAREVVEVCRCAKPIEWLGRLSEAVRHLEEALADEPSREPPASVVHGVSCARASHTPLVGIGVPDPRTYLPEITNDLLDHRASDNSVIPVPGAGFFCRRCHYLLPQYQPPPPADAGTGAHEEARRRLPVELGWETGSYTELMAKMLAEWDATSNRIFCAYCGEEYPARNIEAARAHVTECEKHPMAALRAVAKELATEALEVLTATCSGGDGWTVPDYAMKQLRAALARHEEVSRG